MCERYRETLTKGTRNLREKFRLRSGAVSDLSAKAREVGAGVVRAIERMSVDAGAGPSDNRYASCLCAVQCRRLPAAG